MPIHYIPRVLSRPENQARHNSNALALGLILSSVPTLPKDCSVLIAYEHYTADYRSTRERPYVIYTRHSGTRAYRASYKTLERAATAARAIEQRLTPQPTQEPQ